MNTPCIAISSHVFAIVISYILIILFFLSVTNCEVFVGNCNVVLKNNLNFFVCAFAQLLIFLPNDQIIDKLSTIQFTKNILDVQYIPTKTNKKQKKYKLTEDIK